MISLLWLVSEPSELFSKHKAVELTLDTFVTQTQVLWHQTIQLSSILVLLVHSLMPLSLLFKWEKTQKITLWTSILTYTLLILQTTAIWSKSLMQMEQIRFPSIPRLLSQQSTKFLPYIQSMLMLADNTLSWWVQSIVLQMKPLAQP